MFEGWGDNDGHVCLPWLPSTWINTALFSCDNKLNVDIMTVNTFLRLIILFKLSAPAFFSSFFVICIHPNLMPKEIWTERSTILAMNPFSVNLE